MQAAPAYVCSSEESLTHVWHGSHSRPLSPASELRQQPASTPPRPKRLPRSVKLPLHQPHLTTLPMQPLAHGGSRCCRALFRACTGAAATGTGTGDDGGADSVASAARVDVDVAQSFCTDQPRA
eukprot:3220739-Prymnesium_polylepis.2